MKKIEIYEMTTPADNETTDPELQRLTTLVRNLRNTGVDIQRYDLTNNPEAFDMNPTVSELLEKRGEDILPITLVNGTVVQTDIYLCDKDIMSLVNVSLKDFNP
ncbi:hypothetical protein AN641_05860 [Candidatus Epulonipiscioides gigas]|nr:hypothetical protein AN641_05860 [Epulopiscium sp. SCG-C07WGA-EpuloA2]